METYSISIVGSGFIGSSLAKYLHNSFDVITLDINSQPEWLSKYKIPHKICDIRNYDQLYKEIGNPSVLIHTAIIQIPQINEKKELAYEVNVLGTQNICKVATKKQNIKGLILTGSWHVFGEREFIGTISENFGYRPDKVEERARLYALSKILQECIVRFYDEKVPNKIFGIIRMGTVLGEHMPEQTAANLFITKALRGEEITPYKHSMYRPMLYIDIEDVCKAFESYIKIILQTEKTETYSLRHIVNIAHPTPITILELANIVKDSIIKHTDGKIQPKISIVDKGIPEVYTPEDKNKIKIDISRLREFLKIDKLISPEESIDKIIKKKLGYTF
ncbi:MAG: NAD(P)-dependent oxidoreductase [Candidatus Aenigmatarchaeota archaeon]